MSEIEKYYNGEIHVDFEEIPIKRKSWEELSQEIIELNNSITWWTNRFNAVERDKRELKKEIERLIISLQAQEELTMNEHIKVEKMRSIIKEVREYIENKLWNYFDERNSYLKVRDNFLQILEKENNND